MCANVHVWHVSLCMHESVCVDKSPLNAPHGLVKKGLYSLQAIPLAGWLSVEARLSLIKENVWDIDVFQCI